jgi:hypothetical protein
MKYYSKWTLILALLSSTVIANDYLSPVDNIGVYKTKLSALSIQNFSSEHVEIDIYGESFNLSPASGLQFDCAGYERLALQIKNNDHNFFEVPCSSRVVIDELFVNQYSAGE